MLEAIRRFVNQHIAPAEGATEEPDPHTVELAAAALLVEVARLEGGIGPDQRSAVATAIRGKFHLTEDEATELLDLAEREASQATDYYQFTRLMVDRFDYGQRVRLVELLWSVAWADRIIAPDEEHLIRKISDLLYLRQADYIRAKLRAKGEL